VFAEMMQRCCGIPIPANAQEILPPSLIKSSVRPSTKKKSSVTESKLFLK
jgi:hypothetical protein